MSAFYKADIKGKGINSNTWGFIYKGLEFLYIRDSDRIKELLETREMR